MSKINSFRYATARSLDPAGPNLPGYSMNRNNSWAYVSNRYYLNMLLYVTTYYIQNPRILISNIYFYAPLSLLFLYSLIEIERRFQEWL